MTDDPTHVKDASARSLLRRAVVYVAGWTMLGAIGVFAIVTLLHIVGRPVDPDGKFAFSFGLLSLYLVMVLAATVVMYLRGLVPLMILGIAMMLSGLTSWNVLIWLEPADTRIEDVLALGGMFLTLYGITILHSGVCACFKPRTSKLNLMRVVTIVLAWCFTVVASIVAMIEFFSLSDLPIVLTMALPALGIGAFVTTLVTPLVIRQDRRRWERARESVGGRIQLDLHCPACGERQCRRVGVGRCTRCRGILAVEIEEPRCECGYLLYQLTSPICPECGRAIPDDRRWPRRSCEIRNAGGEIEFTTHQADRGEPATE